jgi:hypothetical protein
VGAGNAADVISILPAIYGPRASTRTWTSSAGHRGAHPVARTTSRTARLARSVSASRYAFALVGAGCSCPPPSRTRARRRTRRRASREKGQGVDPVRSMQINRMDSLLGLGNLYQDNGAVCVAGA